LSTYGVHNVRFWSVVVKYTNKKVDGVDVFYSADWINGLENEMHFSWYYHQAKTVYDNCVREDTILEIGVGTGLLSSLLKKRNWNVTTLDIDADKKPDICESALDFNYIEGNFNTVLAFEVFEHMPYITFQKVINKLQLSKVKKVYFSLPWNERQLMDFKLHLPFFKELNFRLAIRRNKISTIAHFWELSKVNKALDNKELVSYKTMIAMFLMNGYQVTALKKIGYIQYFEAKLLS